MTRLAVPLTAKNETDLLARIRRSQELGAEAVEVRLDFLTEPVDYARVVKACAAMPIIWTNRSPAEGGSGEGILTDSEDRRIGELMAAASAGGRYVDIEYQCWSASEKLRKQITSQLASLRKSGQIKLILSYHNFKGVPKDIDRMVEAMTVDADVVKFAVMAKDIFDNFVVFDAIRACRKLNKPVIGLAMGPAGEISRILAKKLGGEITFASLDDKSESAPGQLTISELTKTYNWDRIGPETKVLGVVGHPIEQSLSPPMHNAAYQQMGFPGVYLRFDVPKDYASFEQFIDRLRRFPDALGVSVTIPHKSNAIQYVKSHSGTLDGLAEHIGAVNTLKFYPDGTVAGINSDYLGFITALIEGAGLLLEELEGKRLAVLGAGGVSRAIVAAMKERKAEVTIYNRTAARAEALAKEFECACRPWDERYRLKAEIVINGTSIGMSPNVDESPLDASAIKPGMIVFDTVYNPLETKLLRLAGEAGAKTIDGLSMLVYQAYEQIEFWTENRYNVHGCISTMRDVALKSLKNKKA